MMTGMVAKADISDVILWSAALLGLLMVGFLVAARLKRQFKQDDAPTPVMGFTLSDLRQLHRDGQLTDEEFAKAKEKIVAASVKPVEKIPAVPGAAPGRDSTEAIRARRLAREVRPADEPVNPPPTDEGQSPDAGA
jgi:hypothetical protein